MPTYEYVCTKCGERLEAVQSFSDPALTDCPHCGKKQALRKVFSAVGVVFKGSGFYQTDSRSASKSKPTTTKEPATANGAKPDSSSSPTTSGGDSSKSSTSSDSGGSSASKDGGSKVA